MKWWLLAFSYLAENALNKRIFFCVIQASKHSIDEYDLGVRSTRFAILTSCWVKRDCVGHVTRHFITTIFPISNKTLLKCGGSNSVGSQPLERKNVIGISVFLQMQTRMTFKDKISMTTWIQWWKYLHLEYLMIPKRYHYVT